MQINVNFIFNWEIFFRVLYNFEFLDSLLSPFLIRRTCHASKK
jgi:hypothetical protein